MLNKELIRTILGKDEDYYTREYMENDFPMEYQLIKKISNILSKEEMYLLFKMADEEYDEMYLLIKHFTK